jgi:hypothetical protein
MDAFGGRLNAIFCELYILREVTSDRKAACSGAVSKRIYGYRHSCQQGSAIIYEK